MVLGVLTNPTLPIVTSIPIYSAMFLHLGKDRHRCSNDKRKYERETRHHRLPGPSQMFQRCQVHMQLFNCFVSIRSRVIFVGHILQNEEVSEMQ